MKKLHVWLSILIICLIIHGNSSAQAGGGDINVEGSIQVTHDSSGRKSSISTSFNDLQFFNKDAGSIVFFTSKTPGIYFSKMNITNEGYVGIGTAVPEQILHVSGGNPRILVEGKTGNPEVNFKNSGDDNNDIWSLYKDSNSDDLRFYQGGDKMTIRNATGNVGIGTTNPVYKLEVAGDAAKSYGGNSWAVASDVRLKDITGRYDRGLTEILELQPVKFFYKEGNPKGLPSAEENVGFVAQDVQEVFPEAISEGSDGYLDFNMHPVNVAVVNAIKELKIENDKLMAENETLRQRIEKIEALLGL